MPPTKSSVSSRTIFALSLLPALVNSYDCNKLVNTKRCDASYQGSRSDYPSCLVSQFGVSAFIQCASQESAPKFTSTGSDGDLETVSALDVLTKALSQNHGCDACPLADNIQNVVMNTSPSPDFQSFGPMLCTQINPVDNGMCCLKKCLDGSPERSIEAYCAEKVDDLMQAQPLLDTCTSNRVVDGDSSSNDDSNSSGGGEPSTTDSSGGGEVSVLETLSPSSQPTQVSTTATTSDVAATSATTTSPAPQVTPTTGAAPERQATFADLFGKLGIVAVLSILVAV